MCFAVEVPRTAAETDTPSRRSDGGSAFSNLLDQFDRLVVPGTGRFNGYRIKHMGPGQLVIFGRLVVGCQIGCSACLSG